MCQSLDLFKVYRKLSVIPILLSMILGYLFSFGVLSAYSGMASEVFGSRMEVSFSPAAVFMAAALSFVTVLLAAHGPAKQMSKILPIEAVRGEQYSIAMCGRTSKKAKSHPVLTKHFGFLGEIAANSVNAGKKLYHTCMVTLSLCMLLAFGFLAVFTASDISNAQAENRNHFDVNITLGTGERIDGALLMELKAVPGVQETSVYARANCAVLLSGSDQSAEFLQAGGFDSADGYIVQRDGRYRVPCVLVGIETFNMDAATKEEITDELVIALFIEDITNVVTNFYSEYYSGEIAVYDYEIAIVDIENKEPGFISVKFGVTPQVGAHNPLGYDELVYRVDSSGNKELVGYEHLKNFEVPEKFQKYMIKPLG